MKPFCVFALTGLLLNLCFVAETLAQDESGQTTSSTQPSDAPARPLDETIDDGETEPDVDYSFLPWRTWHYAGNDRTMYGQFDSIADFQNVSIFDRNGAKVIIPIYELSNADIFEAVRSSMESASEDDVEIIMLDESFELMIDDAPDMLDLHQEQDSLFSEVEAIELEEFPMEQELSSELQPPPMSEEEMELLRQQMIEEERARVEAAEQRMRDAVAESQERNAAAAALESRMSDEEADPSLQADRRLLELIAQWNQLRTWTDKSGSYTFQGTFQKLSGEGDVTLIDETGEEVEVPLSRLSLDDIYVAVHGELSREGGTPIRRFAISSDWIPGQNKN
ncbi:MAG: SHD1 domain-containing protein [Planctomycetota bacterium]